MIRVGVDTNNEQQTLIIRVQSRVPMRIRCRVIHAVKILGKYAPGRPNTVYADHIQQISGPGSFYIRMPQAPKHAIVELFDAKTRGIIVGGGELFSVVPFSKEKPFKSEILLTKPEGFDYKNRKLQEAVRFFQWFSDYAGVLSAGGSVYGSTPSYHIRLDYHDSLRDRQTGKDLGMSPARIGAQTKIIEVSQKAFLPMTVQQRMAILMHEYGHGFLNKNMVSETESDLNALKVLIGLGYSRSEVAKVFLKVFDQYNTPANAQRWQIIKDFISNYEVKDLSYVGDSYSNIR